MRKMLVSIAAIAALATAVALASIHPHAGRYEGTDSTGRTIAFGFTRHPTPEVYNFRITHINGDANTYFSSTPVHTNKHFLFRTSEGEVEITGEWTSDGTVKGWVKTNGVHSHHYTVHLDIPNP